MASQRPASPAAKRISPAETEMLLNLGRAVTVDVRPPEYYANGHIPGAISAPLRELRQYLPSFPRDKTIVFY